MIKSWDVALSLTKKLGGIAYKRHDLEVKLGQPLPAIVTGCQNCGEAYNESSFSTIWYILVNNDKLAIRADRSPFGGVCTFGNIRYTAIAQCRYCECSAPVLEVLKSPQPAPGPVPPSRPAPTPSRMPTTAVKESKRPKLPDIQLKYYRPHLKRLVAIAADPNNHAICFKARGVWFVTIKPYRHEKNCFLLPGSFKPAGAICRGPASLCRSILVLYGKHISAKLKAKILSQIKS